MKTSKLFGSAVTCVVINLEARPDRWKRMGRICRMHGIDPQRFSAHDRERGRAAFPDSSLSPAELGLWSSFVTVISQPFDTEWILVLEDDALLLPRFRRRALTEIRRAPADVYAIRMAWLGRFSWLPGRSVPTYLGKVARNVALTFIRGVQGLVRRNKRESKSIPWGAHATLIRRETVDRLIAILNPGTEPLDGALIRLELDPPHHGRRAQWNCAWQWHDSSDIQLERINRRRPMAR